MSSPGENSFNFSKATNDIVLGDVKKLNTKKESQFNVSTNYINKFSDSFTQVVIDNCITIAIFPECFKTVEVIPTYKKGKPTEKVTAD